MTIYLIDGVHIASSKVKIGFAIVCVTSPTSGAVMSDYLSKAFIGDDYRKVVPFLLIITFFATACAVPLPFLTNYWLIIASLWGYLFFGGILVPIMTFYMLNSIDE